MKFSKVLQQGKGSERPAKRKNNSGAKPVPSTKGKKFDGKGSNKKWRSHSKVSTQQTANKAQLGKRKGHAEDTHQTKKARPSKPRRQKPSEDALKLSESLKALSREKNLEGALKVYWDPSNVEFRDGHHACIVVDCCARCGKIAQGEELVNHLTKDGQHVNVETKTALLKGFSHSGQVDKAEALFEAMCNEQAKSDRPNVRTLNTLLRGCLWSPAHLGENGAVSGGVVTAEKAWARCIDLQEKDKKGSFFDVSSYEYSIALLCQALRTDEAVARVAALKSAFEVTSASASLPQSLTESLSLSYLALARAHATLGENSSVEAACQQSQDFAKASRERLNSDEPPSRDQGHRANKQGKGNKDEIREKSNALFRGHRLKEVEMEAQTLLEICQQDGLSTSPRALARRMATRLIALSGGGTTEDGGPEKAASPSGINVQSQLVNTLYFCYGLQAVLKKLNVAMNESATFLRKRDCNRVLGAIGLQGGIIRDGVLDLNRIFTAGLGGEKGSKKRGKKRSLEIELGAGFGDWIVRKALGNPTNDYISVELRADRVGQTFSRTAALAGTTPVDNLCIVGGDSESFLSNYVKEDSVSTIYINHPEPPTQTYGADGINLQSIMEGGPEPAHMISSRLVLEASNCLSKVDGGRLVIVTDNIFLGRLVCATMVKVTRENKGLLVPVELGSAFNKIESFPSNRGGDLGTSIPLYEGTPNEEVGHSKASISVDSGGASYFDRLWRSGAGAHAEKKTRYLVVMSRSNS